MTKADIAAVLTEIGTLLELKGENPFKTRAYQTGARTLEAMGEEELATRVQADTLQEVKGIGEALGQKITELHETGRLEFFEKLKASVPPGVVDMLTIPGMGPKKVRALQAKLGIDSIEKLRAACEAGQVAGLEGFGDKTQEKILAGIKNREAYGKRHLWFEAWTAAEPILAGLRALPGVLQVESCGSLRRRMETVGDLDFLVATTNAGPVVDWFVAMPGVREVTAKGEFKASVRLESGLQADLRLVPPEQFVFALHHLTGSKDHNVQMRQRALERGLSLSEWGLFAADDKHGPSAAKKAESGRRPGGDGEAKLKAEGEGSSNAETVTQLGNPQLSAFGSQLSIMTESDLFAALGLHYIPPELREGQGEIEAAEISGGPASLRAGLDDEAKAPPKSGPQGRGPSQGSNPQVAGIFASVSRGENRGQAAEVGRVIPNPPGLERRVKDNAPYLESRLPRLIEEGDIRGVFHNHTTASDGHNTLEEMTAAAQELGLDYLGIADHSKSSFQARGLTEERLSAQIAEIAKLNASGKFKCHVFAGTECDILPDGRLDFDAGLLAQLDYTVVSIHSSFRQERDVMTARIIKAIESPHVTMLAHLTGRLLLEREGYLLDAEKIIDAAIANRVVIELNANPWRLDMDWRLWRKAAEKGLLTSINPDAHRTAQLAFYKIGVGVARKGWLTCDHVVNTKPLAEMKAWLAARR